MSLIQRTKQGFLRLPFLKQVVLVSSLGLMISTVMPWYDERNSFGIGETYLGIQGPFFLIGLMVAGFGAVSFFKLFLPLTGKHFFSVKKSGLTSFFMGIQALLLLVVANSIFYHPEFGANISSKSTRFGMTFAFICLGIMVVSGWLTRNKEETVTEEITTPERSEAIPLRSEPIDVPVQTSFTQPVQSNTVPPSDVDPLTLDPRTRYKLMQARMRQMNGQQERTTGNYWGGARASGTAHYGPTPSSIHAEPNRLDV